MGSGLDTRLLGLEREHPLKIAVDVDRDPGEVEPALRMLDAVPAARLDQPVAQIEVEALPLQRTTRQIELRDDRPPGPDVALERQLMPVRPCRQRHRIAGTAGPQVI